MLRRMMLLLLCLMLTGCSALPAEDRSFAVVLGVSMKADMWEVSARIPSYQTGGGYLTLSAQGASLQEALAVLDAAAPMRMHYGQVRLLVFGHDLAASSAFPDVLGQLAQRPDMRLQAEVCVTRDSPAELMEEMDPQTGARLSKSLDILLETRRRQGVIPEASLSSIVRMGERQYPVLLGISLPKDPTLQEGGMDAAAGEQAVKGAGKIQLAGGWLVGEEGCVRGEVTAAEMQLLNLMQNKLRKATVMIGGSTVTLADAGSRVSLDGNSVLCELQLRYTDSMLSEEGIIRELHRDVTALKDKLAAAGCDALGLGGYAIRHYRDMAAWHALNWPGIYPSLAWEIRVSVHGRT